MQNDGTENEAFAVGESQICATKRKHAAEPVAAVPWWALKLALKDGPRAGRWLGNTTEFRAVLSRIYSSPFDGCFSASALDLYVLDEASAEAIRSRRIDWRWYPAGEVYGSRWRPPREMRAAQRASKGKTEALP